jgi:hypothetical protein
MSNAIYSKTELAEHLSRVQHTIASTIEQASLAALNAGTTEAWSAADYLKHLIISVKPVAKAMAMPPEGLAKMFGESGRASRSYAEIVAEYQARIDAGMRAEDAGNAVIPAAYRYPEGVTVGDQASEMAHLKQAWQDANTKLLAVLHQSDDATLDSNQLPHPAIGLLTLREMLFFTVHHNTLHARDIEQAIAKATA